MSTPKQFAKLFSFEDIGQVLIFCGENDDGDPAVVTRIAGNEFLTPTATTSFPDAEAGEAARNREFDAIDEAAAYATGKEMFDLIASIKSDLSA